MHVVPPPCIPKVGQEDACVGTSDVPLRDEVMEREEERARLLVEFQRLRTIEEADAAETDGVPERGIHRPRLVEQAAAFWSEHVARRPGQEGRPRDFPAPDGFEAAWVAAEIIERDEGEKRPGPRFAGPSLQVGAPPGDESKNRPVKVLTVELYKPTRLSAAAADDAHGRLWVDPELLGVLQMLASRQERDNLLLAKLKTEAKQYLKTMDCRRYTSKQIARIADNTAIAAMDVPDWEQAGNHFLADRVVQRNMREANQAYRGGALPVVPGWFTWIGEWWQDRRLTPTIPYRNPKT
jgi:hypothetical protein